MVILVDVSSQIEIRLNFHKFTKLLFFCYPESFLKKQNSNRVLEVKEYGGKLQLGDVKKPEPALQASAKHYGE